MPYLGQLSVVFVIVIDEVMEIKINIRELTEFKSLTSCWLENKLEQSCGVENC